MSAVLIAVLALLALCLLGGAILGFAAVRFRVEGDPIAEQINALLPQTQCGQCGYPGCKPYAEAIAGGDKINKCPPGGEATIQALADLLDVEPEPLDAEGGEKPQMVAYIREAECIGCTAHPGLPGGRHRRRGTADAHRHHLRVHRLRPLRRALPGGLHRHDRGRQQPAELEPAAGARPADRD